MSIGDRLREEREKLGFSQASFAEITGAHRKSQGNYEQGERMPDAAYLAAIAAAGADVLYILTGSRSAPVAPSLSPRQRALLDNYDHTSEAGKKVIEGTASLAAQSVKKGRAA